MLLAFAMTNVARWVWAENTLESFELVQDDNQQLEVRVRSDKQPEVVTETKEGTVSIILKGTKLSAKQKGMPVVLDNKGQYIGRAVPNDDGSVKIVLPNMHASQVKLKVNYVPSGTTASKPAPQYHRQSAGLTVLPQPPTPLKHQGGWQALEPSLTPVQVSDPASATLPRLGFSGHARRYAYHATVKPTVKSPVAHRKPAHHGWFWQKPVVQHPAHSPAMASVAKKTPPKPTHVAAQMLATTLPLLASPATASGTVRPLQTLRPWLEATYRPHLALALPMQQQSLLPWLLKHQDTLAYSDLGFWWHFKPTPLTLTQAPFHHGGLRPYRLVDTAAHHALGAWGAPVEASQAWHWSTMPLGMLTVLPRLQTPYAVMETDLLAWEDAKETPLTLMAQSPSESDANTNPAVTTAQGGTRGMPSENPSVQRTLQSQQPATAIASLASPEGPVKVMTQASADPVTEMLRGMGLPESATSWGYIGFYGAVVLVGVLLLGAFGRMFLGGWAAKARGALTSQGLPSERSPVGIKWASSSVAASNATLTDTLSPDHPEQAFAEAHPFWQDMPTVSSSEEIPMLGVLSSRHQAPHEVPSTPDMAPHTAEDWHPDTLGQAFQGYQDEPSQPIASQFEDDLATLHAPHVASALYAPTTEGTHTPPSVNPSQKPSHTTHHESEMPYEAPPSIESLEADLNRYTQAYLSSAELSQVQHTVSESSSQEVVPHHEVMASENAVEMPLQIPPLHHPSTHLFDDAPLESPLASARYASNPSLDTWGVAPSQAWIFQEQIGAGLKRPALSAATAATPAVSNVQSAQANTAHGVHFRGQSTARQTPQQKRMQRWMRRLLPPSILSS